MKTWSNVESNRSIESLHTVFQSPFMKEDFQQQRERDGGVVALIETTPTSQRQSVARLFRQ